MDTYTRTTFFERQRPTCGAWMPYAKERCARFPGHAFEHRSAYALDNSRRAKRVQPSEPVPDVPVLRVWRCPACGRPSDA